MKRACLFLMLLAWAFIGYSPVVRAQFDPNCYYPQIGVPGEIDTIVGGHAGQGLGGNAFSPGPAPGSPFNRVFFQGFPNNPAGWDIITGGPFLDIHASNPPKSNLVLGDGTKVLGHFHNSKLTDILYNNGRWRIYWSDEQGMYDSSRFTVLEYQSLGKGNFASSRDILNPPYVAHLTSDSIDDIILGYATVWPGLPAWEDTLYIVFYRGGASLFHPGDTVLNDEGVPSTLPSNSGRGGTVGDFRGSGREDFVAQGDSGALFYYKNDIPFSLTKFASAMEFDSLYSPWQNPEIPIPQTTLYWFIRTTRGIVSNGNKNADALEGSLVRADEPYQQNSENFWKASPDFGSHRIFARDTDFAIRSPAFYGDGSEMGWGGMSFPCGDMTGTGNPVVVVYGGEPGYTNSYYYVLGEAADPYADMFIGQAYGAAIPDTITADGDIYGDLITGDPSYFPQIGPDQTKGTIEIIHGSRKIPVRLNPRFAKVTDAVRTGDSLRIAPNPCSTHTVVTWESSCSGAVELQLYDVMGRQVYQERRPTTGTLESFSLDLPKLPNGEYFLVLIQEPCVQRGRIIIQE